MIVSKLKITDIIPQRPPFVMMDNLLEAGSQNFESDFIITDDNIFNDKGRMMEPGLVENIAQTCAAGFGYLQGQASAEPKLGFIGAVTKLMVYNLPAINTKIITRVEVLHQLENVFLVKGENFNEAGKLLECELKIVLM